MANIGDSQVVDEPRLIEIFDRANLFGEKYGGNRKYIAALGMHESNLGRSFAAYYLDNYYGIMTSVPNGYQRLHTDGQADYIKNFKPFENPKLAIVEDLWNDFFKHYDPSPLNVATPEEFVQILHNNGYFHAPLSEYTAAFVRHYNSIKDSEKLDAETAAKYKPGEGGSSSKGASAFNTGGAFGVSYTKEDEKPTPGSYQVYKAQKLKPNETLCVPIYPDIISVYNQIPDWAMKDFVGEENAKVDPIEGGVNKYKKIKSKMKPQGGGSTANTSQTSGSNSSTAGTNEDSKTTKKEESKKEESKKEEKKIDAEDYEENIPDTGEGGISLGEAFEEIKQSWEERIKHKKKDTRKPHSPKTGFKSANFIDESRIPKVGNSLEIPEPIPINPGASNPLHKKGKYKALEIGLPTTTIPASKEKAEESAKDTSKEPSENKPEIAASNIPQSAYDIEDNHHGCFNVVLPLGAVAKYGGENAQEALKYVQTLAQRQIRFDPREHSNAIKAPFPGKIQNNNDPFPVDMRIRDLETHFPRIVIDNITGVSEFEQATNKALLKLGSDTEKRVVQIENHLATTMRYLWRLASIVQINDVYYGGNSMYEKYHSIRMLDDYLINDGFQTQLDQYLTSTKVEPIIGQTYEFLNQVGANLSLVLDDNQLSYSNMDHYVRLNDITKYQKPLKMATIHEAASLTKEKEDMVYNDMWGDGFVMNWTLVPVEQQKPMINWRQSIIDDGSALMNTPPLYGTADSVGVGMTGDFVNNIFFRTALELEGSKNIDIIKMVKVGEEKVKQYEDQATNIAKSKEVYTKLREEVKNSGLPGDFSTAVIAILMCIKDTSDFKGILDDIKKTQSKLKDESLITNPLLIALAYLSGPEYIIGDKPTKDPSDKKSEHEELKTRLDFVYKIKSKSSSSSDTNKENKEDKDNKESNSSGNKIYFNLSIGDEAKWKATQFMEPYSINCHEKREEPVSIDEKFQQLVTLSICYKHLSKKFMLTEFDNENWGFFIEPQYIQKMYIAGFPGERRDGGTRLHKGFDIDIEGSESGQFQVKILSPCDAYVEKSDDGWSKVVLNAMNGTNWTVCFLHLDQRFVKPGDKVERGQPIGIMGNRGEKGEHVPNMAWHIHVELWPDGYWQGSGAENHSIGDCYPGIFQDYCADAKARKVREYSQGDVSYFRNFSAGKA